MRDEDSFTGHPGEAGHGVGEGLDLPLPRGSGGDIGRRLRALDGPTPVAQEGGYTQEGGCAIEAIGACLDAVLGGFGVGARA